MRKGGMPKGAEGTWPGVMKGLRAKLSRIAGRLAALGEPRGLPRGLAPFLLVFAAGMLIVSLLGDQGLVAYWMLRAEEEALRRNLVRLEAREAELLLEIEALRTNPAYIEQVARRELGFVRPEEILVQLPPREGER
jgi:cell division protein FtsB